MQKIQHIIKFKLKTILRFFSRHIYISVFVGLLVFLVLTIAGQKLKSQENQKSATQKSQIETQIFRVGKVPKLSFLAKIEKDNVVKVYSQTSGVVQNIYHEEGDTVSAYTTLMYLSTNYQGDNLPFLQRKIAESQKKNTEETFSKQIELINEQKKIAEKTEENSEELRKISRDSTEETKTLLSLNEDILNSLNKNLSSFEATNSAGVNDSVILSTKQLKSSFLSAVNQLKNAIRQTEYQSDEQKNPSELGKLQKATVLKQLELQEKSLNLNKEITTYQFQIAKINESLNYPISPVSGKIQKVYVKTNQLVSPGSLLFEVAGKSQSLTASLLVSKNIAKNVSLLENSRLIFDTNSFETLPAYVSDEAVENTSYLIKFQIPEIYSNILTDQEYIKVELPIGYPESNAADPFIPIEAVFQAGNESYVYLAKNGKAEARKVKLNEVYGDFIGVDNIENSDLIILNRAVLEGDKIKILN